MYRNQSIKKYLDDLAAKKPAPGGGSAAALAGAVGVALLSRAVNFTVGKDQYKHYEQQLQKLVRQTGKTMQKSIE